MIAVQYRTEYFKLSWTIFLTEQVPQLHLSYGHDTTRNTSILSRSATCAGNWAASYNVTTHAHLLGNAYEKLSRLLRTVLHSAPRVKLYTPKQCWQNFKKIIKCWLWGTVMATKLHSISSQYISKNCLLPTLCCSYPCIDVTILCTNLTNALMYVNITLFTLTPPHVSALKGPSTGSIDTFRDKIHVQM